MTILLNLSCVYSRAPSVDDTPITHSPQSGGSSWAWVVIFWGCVGVISVCMGSRLSDNPDSWGAVFPVCEGTRYPPNPNRNNPRLLHTKVTATFTFVVPRPRRSVVFSISSLANNAGFISSNNYYTKYFNFKNIMRINNHLKFYSFVLLKQTYQDLL